MAVYTGLGTFPYWMTVTDSGAVSGVSAVSENIPVTVGLLYQFQVICSYASTYASGVTLQLQFFDVNGNVLQTNTGSQSNMTGGVPYQVNTGQVTAPSSSVYAVAQIILNGTPATSNPLSVYQAEIDDQNYTQVNINFTFTWTTFPWSPSNSANCTLAWNFAPQLTGDSDSLVLDGIIELMGGGGGVPCTVPELLDSNGVGPTYRLLAPPSLNSSAFGYENSYDLNAPQPTQDVVASMLLDGERPFGDRASNRTINLPIIIFGTLAGGMSQVLKAREYLMSVIDQQYWQIKWTSVDTGLPVLFDCFRALPTAQNYGFNYSAGYQATGSSGGRANYPIAMMTLSVQALPYARSEIDGVQSLAFNSPLIGGVQTSQSATIDPFNTVFNPPPIINLPTWTSIGTSNPTSVSTFSVNVTANSSPGSTVLVEIQTSANNMTSVTDTQGNVYTQIASKQVGSSSQWAFLYLAPVAAALTTSAVDHITVLAGGTQNFQYAAYNLSGAWSPRSVLVSSISTGTTFSSSLSGLNPYDLLFSATFGAGSAGATPTGFTSVATPSGNGWNSTLTYYAMPVNQTTEIYTVPSGLPNPAIEIVVSLLPVNQYWNQDLTTPPPTFIGHSAHYTPPRPYRRPYPAATYQQTLVTPVNITNCTVLSMFFGQAYDVQWPKDPKFVSNCTFQWQLTDNLGRHLNFSVAKKKVLYGTHPTAPKWTLINAAIPQGRAFSYNAVASYFLRITNWSEAGNTGYIRMHAWINDIQANPQTIQNAVSPRGSVYNLFSLPGSARAPISVQCQLPAAQNIVKEITTPSSGTWIVPPGVYSVQAEAWGAGGAGGATNLARSIAAGGGGGGEYAAEPALNVMPGWKVPWTIGAGGTPGQLTNTVVQYTKAGLGHWTCPANVSVVIAEMWGGGAAGGAGAGGGGGGEYVKARVNVTPGKTYNIWTGAGGKADTGTSASQVAARQGSSSWFAAPGITNPSLAISTAQGGKTSTTGSSSGGNGGTSGTVAPGTQFACIATKTSTATKTTTWSPNNGAAALTAGATGIIVVTVPAAATITISDTSKNVWSQIGGPVTNTGVFTYVFWCLSANALNKASVLTLNQSISQGLTIGTYNAPWVCGQDATNTSGSGASTGPTITSATPNSSGDLVLAIFSNSTTSTNGNPAGWTTTPHLGTGGAGGFTDVYAIQNASNSTETATASYASSQNWCAIALTFATETHYPGGRGGTSPGPSGGGGGGAAGATGAGGVGGDSQPFISGVGQWQQGGTGGTGTGLGGNGGAGANTPGYPGTGIAPGGAGGGGYQSPALFSTVNPFIGLPGNQQSNFLGGDGAVGMVQLTYTVGNGSPVNGGNTTFGSTGTTATVVTAHGGLSVANNSATGALGGTGSSNTTHNNGGNGGLLTNGAMGSYLAAPVVTTLFQSLSNGSFNATSNTSGTAASSCAQGVAIALIESTVQVNDLVVTDSAGNQYQNQGVVRAGNGGLSNVALYAYVANIEIPITTSTTLTITSATSQQYGFLWYASPWLVSGVTAANSGSGHNTSGSFTGTFGIADTSSIELQLGVVISDGSTTVTGLTQTKTWFNAGSTNSQAAGTMNMAAYTMQTQGGGNGAVGDVFSGTLSGSANWGVLCVPLTMINQTDALIRVDNHAGTVPGASTSWTFNPTIGANGLLVVLGFSSGTGAASAGPTGCTDQSGNVYTKLGSTQIAPSATGWVFTAPVTAGLGANTTGQLHWGGASASNSYAHGVYWVPNATGTDASGISTVTGIGVSPTGVYTPASPNDFLVGLTWNSANAIVTAAASAPWNYADNPSGSGMNGQVWVAQATDLAATTLSGDSYASSHTWATVIFGLTQTLSGTGGGAAGNPNGAGYNGVWTFGGPGFGGGKGGQGAVAPPQAGSGGALLGGGGGGALGSSAAPQEGGQGAQGGLRLTWTPPLQTFNSLIVHSLGPNADPNVNPIVPIPITDVPNNTEYAIPSVQGFLNASFNSTYTVILSNFFWNSSTSSTPRQITVTINQYEYPGGPKYSYQVSKAITPATDSVNGLLSMGEVTLPVKDYVAYNDQSYFTVSINDTDSSDRFMDVLFLDTLGQSVLINIDPGQPGYGQYVNFFIDEATPDRDLGFVGASMQDREHQVGVLEYTQISGGPLYIGPGDNIFLVYSTSGAPNLSVTYAPRWYLDRSV